MINKMSDYNASQPSGGVYKIQPVNMGDLYRAGQYVQHIDRRSENGFVPNIIHPTGFPHNFTQQHHYTNSELELMKSKSRY